MSNVSFGGKHYSLFCLLGVQVSYRSNKGQYRYIQYLSFLLKRQIHNKHSGGYSKSTLINQLKTFFSDFAWF